MKRIDPEYLYAIAPGASKAVVDGIVAHQALLAQYGLTDDDVPFFFGQIATETGGFTKLEENLTYTSIKRLRQVWPARFPSDAAAAPYIRNPQALANLTYGGRLGNRSGTSDGWNFRGSGAAQTTGRYNFSMVEKATSKPATTQPDLLRSFPLALEAACVYWRDNKLLRFVANGDIVGLTKAWQGGDGGLADRRLFTDRAQRAWKALPPTKVRQRDENPTWPRKGLIGEQVTHIQKRLQAHGEYVGGVLDGRFGDATDDAVRAFQASRGLVVDGVVGEATLKALNAPVVVATAPVGTGTKPGVKTILDAASGPCGKR